MTEKITIIVVDQGTKKAEYRLNPDILKPGTTVTVGTNGEFTQQPVVVTAARLTNT